LPANQYLVSQKLSGPFRLQYIIGTLTTGANLTVLVLTAGDYTKFQDGVSPFTYLKELSVFNFANLSLINNYYGSSTCYLVITVDESANITGVVGVNYYYHSTNLFYGLSTMIFLIILIVVSAVVLALVIFVTCIIFLKATREN